MKRNDIMLIVVCIFVSATLSLVLSNILFGSSQRQAKVEVVEAIVSDFAEPSDRYFNPSSINPTQQISIGNNSNPIPLGQ